MAAVRLEHVAIKATEANLDDIVSFYVDNFDWSVLRRLPGICFISDGHGGRIEVYVAEGAAMTHPVHLAFAVPIAEYDALRQRLVDAGVAIDETTNAAGDRLGYFDDPGGNRAQIVGRNEPMPE